MLSHSTRALDATGDSQTASQLQVYGAKQHMTEKLIAALTCNTIISGIIHCKVVLHV